MIARKGVWILLEPGTRVRNWIRNQTLNVEMGRWRLILGSENFDGRVVRSLKIRNGEASFFPSGGVQVKMPGSDESWVAFRPMKVLEIRDLKGNLIKRNHYLCTKCCTLTGKRESERQSDACGLIDANLMCTNCGKRWELKRI